MKAGAWQQRHGKLNVSSAKLTEIGIEWYNMLILRQNMFPHLRKCIALFEVAKGWLLFNNG